MRRTRTMLAAALTLAAALSMPEGVAGQCTPETQELINQVWTALQSGQQESGQQLLNQLTEGHGNCAETHYTLGTLGMVMNQPAEAEAAFGRAIELDPSHARSFLARATLLVALGRPDDALADADQVIALSANVDETYEAHTIRAAVLYRAADFDQLATEAEAMIALNPDWGDAYQLRAAVRVEREQWPGAIADLQAANELGRRAGGDEAAVRAFQTENMVGLGRARLEMGELTAAQTDLDEVIRRQPDNGRAYFYRARVHQARGRLPAARADLALAIEHARSDEDRAQAQALLAEMGED